MLLRWTPRAIRDLEGIADFVAQTDIRAADRLVIRIEGQAARLVDHPNFGRTGRVSETRELVISGTRYVVAYAATASSIDILAVIHEARRWPSSFSET